MIYYDKKVIYYDIIEKLWYHSSARFQMTPERCWIFPRLRNVFPLKRNAGEKWRGAMHFNFHAGNRFVWTSSRCVPIFSFWIDFLLSLCTSVAVRLRLDLLTRLLSSIQFCTGTFMQKTDAAHVNSYIKWNFSALVTYFYPSVEKESAHSKVLPRARTKQKSASFYVRGICISCKCWQ